MSVSGEQLGAYTLLERIGAGGMGEVWKGEDTRLGRIVAIKILPQKIANDAEAIARMRREARTAAQLSHPNIATIHAFEETAGRLFIVLEYVDGEPLTRLIERGPMAETEICRIGRAIAEALAEAHAKGIVHRDIKPDNVVVAGQRVKVLDFGIAKQVGIETTSGDAPTAFLTQQGMILGTVHYMSPEQALGKALDARTDLFSLGVVLYQAATGQLPFQGETVTETITKIVRDEPRAPRALNPRVSSGMSAIIQRCLKKNREERFASATELARAFEQQMLAAPTAPYTGVAAAPGSGAVRSVERAEAVALPRGAGAVSPAGGGGAAPTVVTAGRPRAAPRKMRSGTLVAIAIALFVIVFAILQAVRRSRMGNAEHAASVTTAIPAPAAAQTSGASETVTSAAPQTTGSASMPETSQPAAGAPSGTAAVVESGPAAGTVAPPPAPAAARSAAAAYDEGLLALTAGEGRRARERFEEALRLDPGEARVEFRLGELALLRGEMDAARAAYDRALAYRERLDARETLLCELGLAICNDDRLAANRLAGILTRMNPGDPDLLRIRERYGFFFGRADGPPGSRPRFTPRPFPRRPPPRR
jgi:hypothetical protein